MDWGGHVHPTFLRVNFLIRLNSIKTVGGSYFLLNIDVAAHSPVSRDGKITAVKNFSKDSFIAK